MKSQPRGLRNNNPGNIRISSVNYQGEIKPSKDTAFKQFESMPYGYRAMFMLLYTYQKRHGLHTIRQIMGRYAPPNENHTDGYINRVAKDSGFDPDTRIDTTTKSTMIPIVSAMSHVENGIPAIMEYVEAGWKMFMKQ